MKYYLRVLIKERGTCKDLGTRDRSFLMGKGAGGIRQVAPVVYDDPPLHRNFLGGSPLSPKLTEMTPPPKKKKRKKGKEKERERERKRTKNKMEKTD